MTKCEHIKCRISLLFNKSNTKFSVACGLNATLSGILEEMEIKKKSRQYG